MTRKRDVKPLPEGKAARDCSTAEKRELIIQQFQLRKSPFLRQREDLEKAVAVMMEFWDSFSHDRAYGRTHLLKHRIIT